MSSRVLVLLRRLRASNFARSVAVVASGTAAAQVISTGLSPIVTRQYGAEAFGLLGTFAALLNALLPLGTLNYASAIGLPKDDEDALGIASLSARIAVAISVGVAIVFYIAFNPISTLLNLEDVGYLIYLIPVGVLLASLVTITNQWMLRYKQFTPKSRVAVLQSFVTNVAKVGWGAFSPTAMALIIIATLGRLAHALMLLWCVRKTAMARALTAKRSGLRELAVRYSNFPRYQMPLSVTNAFAEALPALMLGSFYGASSVGFYAICRMALWVPIGLVAQSVGEVFYPKINEAVRERRQVRALIVRATVALAAIAIVPSLVLIVKGPELFAFVFGDEWSTAGVYSQSMAILLFSSFINRPAMAAAGALGVQRAFLLSSILGLILKAVGIYIGFAVFNSSIASVALFAVAGAASNAMIIQTAIAAARQGEARGLGVPDA